MTTASSGTSVGLPPPQFRLRTLLLVTAVFAAVFGLATAVSTATFIVIVWFLILASLHVAAAAIGHRQRHRTAHDADERLRPQRQSRQAGAIQPSSPHRLRQNAPVGLIVFAASACGAAGGLLVGTLALVGIGKVGPAGIALGGLSAAVVGGFLGFLLGSFLATARRAWLEATQEVRVEITINSRH